MNEIAVQQTIVNLAEETGSMSQSARIASKLVCKFVYIAGPSGDMLVYGPVSIYPYHAELVSRFCDQRGIPSAWVKKPDLCEILAPGFAVKGGGWLEISRLQSVLSIYGTSTAYGKYERPLITGAIGSDSVLADFSTVFEDTSNL